MKKFAIVSLLVVAGLVVVAAVGAVALYQLAYKPTFSGKTSVVIAQALERDLEHRTPFEPPGDGRLTEQQIARFVSVADRIEAKLGSRTADLRGACERLQGLDAADALTLADAMKETSGVASLIVDVKRVQVAAMNDARFTREEYDWVRRQVYAVAGVPFAQLDRQGFLDATTHDARILLWQRTGTGGDPEAKRLVEPHADRLVQWRALAFFDD